jgi:predicted nucleic acid-binding protein
MLVVDASVFIKLFRTEEDSPLARTMLDTLIERDEPFIAPSIVLYEVLSNALHFEQPFAEVADFFATLRPLGLSIEEPTKADLAQAQAICTMKAPIGGYPTLIDSIYHAMAIERGGTFVTADAKHVAKTAHLGHVALLADWRVA